MWYFEAGNHLVYGVEDVTEDSMVVGDILEILNRISPFELQESWDNSSLQVGSKSSEISQVVLSIDIDLDMIQEYQKNTLFILHHPIIFGKLESLNFDHYPQKLLRELILKNHSVIAMHTNFDKTHLNRYVFEKILGFEGECKDFICQAKISLSMDELKVRLSKAFGENLKVINPKDSIKSIALTTGAGGSFIGRVDADCFLSGDIKYHDAMKALALDLMVVDVGHFESERYFGEALFEELKSLDISVIISQSKKPFSKL
jgi:dinuclear metal center YbgI/SA1388 family protein